MTTRARDLLNRSRALLGASRDSTTDRPALEDAPSPPTREAARSEPTAGSAVAPTRPGIRAVGLERRAIPSTTVSPGLAATASAPEPPTTSQPPAASEPSTTAEVLSAICADIALRDLNLVDLLLSQLEEMESAEEDADRLAELYRLDHLAARLRRNAENLRVLAGHDASEDSADSTAFVDVVRAAMSSIDHFSRVTIGKVVSLGIIGFAAEDLGRVVAELLDNATKSSPPTTPVRVGVHLTETGSALLRVEDEGIGLPPERLEQFNTRLAEEPVLDDDAVRHMGLAVVHRLAIRHGLRIWLDSRQPHGTTASVLIPSGLVCELPEGNWSGTQTVRSREEADSDRGRPEPPGATLPAPHSNTFRLSALRRAAGVGNTSQGTEQRQPPSTLFGGAAKPTSSDATTAAGPVPSTGDGAGLPAGPPPPHALTDGTTATGLPRRVSRSLRNPASPPAGAAALPAAADVPAADAPAPRTAAKSTAAESTTAESTTAEPPDADAGTATTDLTTTDPTTTGLPIGADAPGVNEHDSNESDPDKNKLDGNEPGDTRINGTGLNGTKLNGTKLNGTKLNGTKLDGTKLNGSGPRGHEPKASDSDSPAARTERRAADHARLLADLDAFTEGERTAHKHQRGDKDL
ncbi:Histidine kinase-, DNA gyrase B-, and HSP90-like ATPase [Parafrankia irregularis]|uniref:histidine kinase n=1 Tax=Parafrankia irregularis TaxID=795642 RepID=A0A0S4QWQ0_9ACTN|nr:MULTISPECIES: ATP-binding protein [Parafrankia]CUU58902.1 Histidine kinase-, DNA gyrase B-, and HSP90-like ATPase [Parafrankia irregularis]